MCAARSGPGAPSGAQPASRDRWDVTMWRSQGGRRPQSAPSRCRRRQAPYQRPPGGTPGWGEMDALYITSRSEGGPLYCPNCVPFAARPALPCFCQRCTGWHCPHQQGNASKYGLTIVSCGTMRAGGSAWFELWCSGDRARERAGDIVCMNVNGHTYI